MRPVHIGLITGSAEQKLEAIQRALEEIVRASFEADVGEVADEYSANGAFTETREVNVTAPSTANLAAVLATFLLDLKKRGIKHET